MLSFIITLTHLGSPVLFRFVNEHDYHSAHSFEVSALNKELPSFTMQYYDRGWKIASPVPDNLRELEPKLDMLIDEELKMMVSGVMG